MNWFWGCAGAALAVTSIPLKELVSYEAKVTRYTIDDAAWHGKGRLRLALITDFHAGDGIWSGRALARLVRKEEVDLICIVGDFFEPQSSNEEIIRFLEELNAWRPVYYVSGNHDEGEIYLDGLKEMMAARYGVHVLDNRHTIVRVKESWVDVFGVRDKGAYKNKNEWLHEVQKVLHVDSGDANTYRVVLCHRPEPRALFDTLNKELVLCGHTHGGQWRFFKKGVFAPGQGLFPKYSRGIYKRSKKHPYHMVLSAGLAVDRKIPRVNNRPELVILDINHPME